MTTEPLSDHPTTTCKKVCFSRLDAMLALSKNTSRTKPNWRRRERRAYYCEKCGAWHLTSQPTASK